MTSQENTWYQDVLQELADNATSYQEKALFEAVEAQMLLMDAREESLAGQLEASVWSHDDE